MLCQAHAAFRSALSTRCVMLLLLTAIDIEHAQSLAAGSAPLIRSTNEADFSFRTDLWRSAFGNPADRLELRGPDQDAQDAVHADAVASLPIRILDGVQGISSEFPLMSSGELPSDEECTADQVEMSDWETSESRVAADGIKTSTKDGPSVVTAIVAIVGVIVVGGAYLSGRASA